MSHVITSLLLLLHSAICPLFSSLDNWLSSLHQNDDTALLMTSTTREEIKESILHKNTTTKM